MIYSSLLFIYVFLPVSLLVYYVTPEKYRNISLLALSVIFCGLNGAGYLLFMAGYTAVNFAACWLIGKYRQKKGVSRGLFVLALVLDISAIFVFRSDFFSTYRELLSIPEEFFPFGISFFALSAIGTLADVYSGRTKPEKNIVYFSLYIMFFPRLIMGQPIRYSAFRKMLLRRHSDLAGIGTGMSLFVKGFAKKVIAADTLYVLYGASTGVEITQMPALTAWLGAVSYILCLYFVISGFSDMGAGIACCFGFRMPKSFNYPVFSQNVRCFTARWHIQISQWFRRYVTNPFLAVTEKRIYRGIIVIAVSGLIGFWYTFSIGGAAAGILWGIVLVIETHFIKENERQITGVLYTFILSLICAVFMAGNSLAYSLKYLFAMIGGNGILADSLSLYLLKSYVLILIASMYLAASFFRNIVAHSYRKKIQNFITAISPVIVLSAMILCTVLISYRGTSDMILLKM